MRVTLTFNTDEPVEYHEMKRALAADQLCNMLFRYRELFYHIEGSPPRDKFFYMLEDYGIDLDDLIGP
jgi:hypothetical protein